MKTDDGVYARVPNEQVFTSDIINYVANPARRIEYRVTIGYRENAEQVMHAIKTLLDEHPFVLVHPAPDIFVSALGDSGVEITDQGLLEDFQDELAGRIALLSDISTGSADMGQVPIDEAYPLSGVHANAVNTILTESFIRELPVAATAAVEILLLLSVTALSFHRSALVSACGTAGIGALFGAAAGLVFLQWNLLVPVVKPLVVMVLGWTDLSTWHALENARVRAEIERARQIAEHELEIGRKIQTGFLPERFPPRPAGKSPPIFSPLFRSPAISTMSSNWPADAAWALSLPMSATTGWDRRFSWP